VSIFRLTLRCGHTWITSGKDGRLGAVMDSPYMCPEDGQLASVMIAERVPE
jgi:hypothetical protein